MLHHDCAVVSRPDRECRQIVRQDDRGPAGFEIPEENTAQCFGRLLPGVEHRRFDRLIADRAAEAVPVANDAVKATPLARGRMVPA